MSLHFPFFLFLLEFGVLSTSTAAGSARAGLGTGWVGLGIAASIPKPASLSSSVPRPALSGCQNGGRRRGMRGRDRGFNVSLTAAHWPLDLAPPPLLFDPPARPRQSFCLGSRPPFSGARGRGLRSQGGKGGECGQGKRPGTRPNAPPAPRTPPRRGGRRENMRGSGGASLFNMPRRTRLRAGRPAPGGAGGGAGGAGGGETDFSPEHEPSPPAFRPPGG